MDQKTSELLDIGFAFHGHRCPAMPLGLRCGVKAMEVLGVGRAHDKELFVLSETGEGHAAGCFLDGIMVATGCTYGKSNVKKTYWNKMAFTLVDTVTDRAVRISLKPAFFEKMLRSPFVQERKSGVPPQDVNPQLLAPLLEKVLSMELDQALDIGEVFTYHWNRPKGCFNAVVCARCGEAVFENAVHLEDGKPVCQGCLARENEAVA